jgi:hypothetical protein
MHKHIDDELPVEWVVANEILIWTIFLLLFWLKAL